MCLCILVHQWLEDTPLIMAANREEHYDRPSLLPAWRPDGLFAGSDQRQGGTWQGLNTSGLLVALTNRKGTIQDPSRRSRGLLCQDALQSASARSSVEWLFDHFSRQLYNPCNLLIADAREAFAIHYDGHQASMQILNPGLHLLADTDVDDPMHPRIQQARALLEELLAKEAERRGRRERRVQEVGLRRLQPGVVDDVPRLPRVAPPAQEFEVDGLRVDPPALVALAPQRRVRGLAVLARDVGVEAGHQQAPHERERVRQRPSRSVRVEEPRVHEMRPELAPQPAQLLESPLVHEVVSTKPPPRLGVQRGRRLVRAHRGQQVRAVALGEPLLGERRLQRVLATTVVIYSMLIGLFMMILNAPLPQGTVSPFYDFSAFMLRTSNQLQNLF